MRYSRICAASLNVPAKDVVFGVTNRDPVQPGVYLLSCDPWLARSEL